MKFLWLCFLGITIFVELMVSALANPDGFVSINCGASEDAAGSDDLLWLSDSPYINVSSRKTSNLSYGDQYLPYRSIAYFPDLLKKKYCYLLPVKSNIPYLVRTRFNYGWFNSERLPLARIFDLLVDGFKWVTLYLPKGDLGEFSPAYYEIILAPKSDRLSLCLARNSETEPGHHIFITTIELRPLDPSMYKIQELDFQKSALQSITRNNFGGNYIDRYNQDKSDKYDRIWWTIALEKDMNLLQINDSLGIGLPNHVPQEVLQTAISSKEIQDLDISSWFVDYTSLTPGSYYSLFYFCNINQTATSGTFNSFKVLINKEETDWVDVQDPLECKYVDIELKLAPNATNMTVVLRPWKDSWSVPFINGAELYKILDVRNTHIDDVLAMREIADAINFPDDWSGGDPCLPSGLSSTGITCSIGNTPRVIIVNLTNMGLVGDIPSSIAKLTALTQLLLGNNSLSGRLPDLSPLKNLTTLQLQNNKLVGSIPPSLEKLSSLKQLYLQNNNLTGTLPRGLVKQVADLRVDPQVKFPANKRKSWPMGISVGCSLLLVLLVICTAFIWRQRIRSEHYTKDGLSMAQHASADVEYQNEYRMLAIEYTEDDIKKATKNYSTVIGKGSFGSVFYGRFSGSDVAVKVLSDDSDQGQLEFHTELTVLSRIHHKNLVNLVGYCRKPVVALVYEYMKCGSLKDHLYGAGKLEKPLDWHTRLNIALQAAEGLHYLHHGCNPPIIHRDIKCNNILLDGNMCAKLADFGLSKVLESSKSYVSTIVKGTIGYLDPQYFETSALTEESDVYSFGIVLLEILSGVSPRDGILESGRKLLSCGRMVDLMDTSLGGRYNLASAWRAAEIAYSCTEQKSINRPKIGAVVKELQEAVALEEDDNLYENVSKASTEGDLPSLR